jgi:hypothetical protein
MKYADLVLRHKETAKEDEVALEVELVSQLEPLALVDALEVAPTLEASWAPDEGLTRDRITIKGTLSVENLRLLAQALLPNADELIHEEAWRPGGRGLAQLVILHAVSVRLRTTGHAPAETS